MIVDFQAPSIGTMVEERRRALFRTRSALWYTTMQSAIRLFCAATARPRHHHPIPRWQNLLLLLLLLPLLSSNPWSNQEPWGIPEPFKGPPSKKRKTTKMRGNKRDPNGSQVNRWRFDLCCEYSSRVIVPSSVIFIFFFFFYNQIRICYIFSFSPLFRALLSSRFFTFFYLRSRIFWSIGIDLSIDMSISFREVNIYLCRLSCRQDML